MRVIILIFSLLCLNNVYTQQTELLNHLITNNVVKVDEKGEKTFKEIISNMEVNQLLLSQSDNNPVVRCYAYWGLAIKKYPKLINLLEKNLNDNETVEIEYYDISDKISVSDFYLKVMYGEIDGEIRLNDNQRYLIDSILLYNDDIKLYAKKCILQNYEPKLNQYSKIKELAIEGYSPFAIIALAKFKNENDLKYIDSLILDEDKGYHALLAIREFPHEKFYTTLLAKHNATVKAKKINYSQLRALYQALAQYPTKQTVSQFELVLKKTKGFKKSMHEKYMWLAIDKYPNDIFNEIKSKLKLTEFEKEDLEGERSF